MPGVERATRSNPHEVLTPSLSHATAQLDEIRVHYLEAGAGPVVVLLHGWPQTSYCWRHVMPLLADRFRVIAPDLRGLGDSSRPESGYDKRTIARDVVQLLETLGIDSIALAGHDWGGVTAFALASTHPQLVRKFAVLDVTVPGDGADGFSQGGKRWHHGFHRMPELPETLVSGREDVYLRWFLHNWAVRPEVFSDDDVAEYVRTYAQPQALHAGFEYYRALPTDIAVNADFLANNPKLTMPALGLGGDGPWARGREVVESLRRVATDVRGGVVEDAGHFLPEERPDVVARELRDFFS